MWTGSPTRHARRVAGAAVLLFASASPAWPQTVDEIVARNLAARGGVEKLRSIDTVKSVATVTGRDGVKVRVTTWVKRPDKMRRDPAILSLVRGVHERGLPIGIICHGGSVAISAGIVGARATGSLGIKDDLVNAGAEWVDEPAFRDGNLVWGRVVADIPDFCRELIALLEESAGS